MNKKIIMFYLNEIESFAKKGGVGAKHNTMRRIRQSVREAKEEVTKSWIYKLKCFILRRGGDVSSG